MNSDRGLLKNKIELFCLLLTLIACGYFRHAGGWNENARLDMVYSFVEPGSPHYLTFQIDRFLPFPEKYINTGDWSYYGGHYYSNKAPGSSLIGIPVYFVIEKLEGLNRIDISNPNIEILNAYLINFFVSVVFTALGIIAFHRILLLLKVKELHALTLTIILSLGTLFFPYSTLLWGHATAAAFTIIALYELLLEKRNNLFLAGVFIGLSVLTDYLAVVNLFFLLLYAFSTFGKRAIWVLFGELLPLLVCLYYNYACFGSPFSLPTDYTNPAFIDNNRILGLFGAVSWASLWNLTFGLRRGMFLAMPILLLVPLGLAFWFRRNKRDPLLWLCIGAIVLHLLMNSSFNGWHGGATVCARYQIVAIPFWLLPLKEIISRLIYFCLSLLLGAVSIVNMFVVASVSPVVADLHPNPLFGWAYPHFFNGELSVSKLPVRLQQLDPQWADFRSATTWNWGQFFGLSGLWSLLPLIVLIFLLGILAFYCVCSESAVQEKNED